MLYYWVIMIVDALHVSDDHYIAKEEYSTMKSVHFYQLIGTLREPSGMYLPYGGYEIIPYVYTVPGIVTHIKDECSQIDHITKIYENMIAHIRAVLGDSNNLSGRQKRQLLLPFVVAASTVLSGFNTLNGIQLNTAINHLRDNADDVRNQIRKMTKSQNLVVEESYKISIIIGEHASLLEEARKQISCQNILTGPEYQSYIYIPPYSYPN